MNARSIALLATAVSLFALPSAAMGGVRDERSNLIGGELMGRGVVLTLNYERFLSNQFGLGLGFMAIKVSGDGLAVIPMYASFVPGDTHSPYFAAGMTLLTGGGDIQDWERTWLVTLSVGYQYQSSGGFFVRPFFSYLRPTEPGTGDQYLLWPALTIGGSF
jgi:hypothetical protein